MERASSNVQPVIGTSWPRNIHGSFWEQQEGWCSHLMWAQEDVSWGWGWLSKLIRTYIALWPTARTLIFILNEVRTLTRLYAIKWQIWLIFLKDYWLLFWVEIVRERKQVIIWSHVFNQICKQECILFSICIKIHEYMCIEKFLERQVTDAVCWKSYFC